jgi:hypothetical protein
MTTNDLHARLLRGEVVAVGTKLYAMCRECRSVVRINKPIIGDIHICAPPRP